MSILELCSLQSTLFLMIIVGAILKKVGVVDDSGKRCLSDLCINIIIPCNIIKSFLIEFNSTVLKSCGFLLIVGLSVQLVCLILNKFLFHQYPDQQKKILQYSTIVSMAGFMGNPVAEGIYGNIGLLYTSIFLIPARIITWSVGTSYFISGVTDKRKIFRNVFTQPCLVGIYIGVVLMVTQVQLPAMLESCIHYIGNCNTAITMFIVGTILADVNIPSIFNKSAFRFSILRLAILPAIALGFCMLFRFDRVATGVSVIMTGMPAGATTAILAARYDCDAPFATKCVVLTTLLSMVTIPIWCYFVG